MEPEELSEYEKSLLRQDGHGKALRLIDALTAQCQRDFALAAEWKATAEAYRVRAEVAETHLEYHRTEDPHALEEALRRASDAESHATSLAQDLAELRKRIATRVCIFEDCNCGGTSPSSGHHPTSTAAEAECAALRAQLESADALHVDQRNKRAAAEGECVALRAEVERWKDEWRVTEEARAAFERAADLLTEQERNAGRLAVSHAELRWAAESSLAAATELLTEMAGESSINPHWRSRVSAFLAAQPAAPARTEPRIWVDGRPIPAAPARCTCSTDCEGICPTCKPAAPTTYDLALREWRSGCPGAPASRARCSATEGENGRGEACRLPRGHEGACRWSTSGFCD